MVTNQPHDEEVALGSDTESSGDEAGVPVRPRSTTPASRSCVASHTSFFGANDIAPRARDRASEAASAETPSLRPDVRLGCGAVWRGSSAVAGCHAAVRLGRDEVRLILYIYL